MKNLKELSLRIKNIESVQKTTKIMQMVSTSKLLQSKKKLLNSKLYISKLHNVISSLMSSLGQELLVEIDTSFETNLIFIIASDRGLCGSFNSSIVKLSQEYVDKLIKSKKNVDVIFWGKKAFDIAKNRFSYRNILKIENSNEITLNRIKSLIKGIGLSKYNKIEVLYNKCYNAFTQKPILETIKPWSKNSSLVDDSIVNSTINCRHEYEPKNIKFILQSLIQNYVIASLYSALLESLVSENSSRMIAMESSNRNSKELINKLTLLYNHSRQTAITIELIEIICGAESL